MAPMRMVGTSTNVNESAAVANPDHPAVTSLTSRNRGTETSPYAATESSNSANE